MHVHHHFDEYICYSEIPDLRLEQILGDKGVNQHIAISGKREFLNVADLLNVPVSEVDDRITWLEKHFHSIYTSTPSEFLKTFVDSVYVILNILFDIYDKRYSIQKTESYIRVLLSLL